MTSCSDGANETGVEEDQSEARDHVDEDDSRPVVDVVVDDLVAGDERCQLVPTGGDFDDRGTVQVFLDVVVDQRLDSDGAESQLAEPANLGRDGRHVDGQDDADGAAH